MDGQLAAVHIVCLVAQQIEKLGVDHSSSVMRVLTTRLRWGVLYRFRMVNLLSTAAWLRRDKRRKPHKQGLGKALPNKIPAGAK